MPNRRTNSDVFAYVKDGNYKDAYDLLIPLAEDGSAYAAIILGWIHENGSVGPRNVELAKRFYEMAARAGDSEAYLRLGVMLIEEGRDLEARGAFEAGAKAGNLGSKYRLGTILVDSGNPSEKPRGLSLLGEAASLGHIFSRRTLLSIEMSQSKSVTTKMVCLVKIIFLSFFALKEALMDSNSDKVL